jgi:uncharacterized membrane protein
MFIAAMIASSMAAIILSVLILRTIRANWELWSEEN